MLSRSDASEPAHAYYSPSTTYTNGDGATYYSGISGTATGTTLLSALQSLNSSKRQKTIGYTAMGTSASSSPYVYTDYDPNGTTYTDSNNQIYGASILSFYSKTSVTSFNKEHTWPNSHGGSAVEADIHMPRPTITAENSNRGNSFYVEGVVSSTSGWDPYTAGYSEISRGEAARTIFYCMVASSSLNLSEATIISSGETGYANTMGKLSDMLSWNLRYSVTTYEQNRNEGAEYLQGNRNPFIDHPEYACKIWGNTNSTTQAICSASQSAPNTITLSPSTSSIAVGGTVTLGVTVDTGSNSVTWSSSNSSVASVSNGVVTGVAAGSATITATSTVDTSIKGTAAITVKSLSSLSVSGTPNTTSYTAGQSFDSTGLTVTATYSDSSTTNVTSSVVWTPSTLTAGTTSVTGSYGEKTVTVSGLTVTASSSSNALYTFSSKSWATATGTDNWVSGKDGIGYANSGVQISTGASGANARSPISFSNMTEIVVGYCTNASKGAGQIIMYSQPTIDGTATEIGRFSVTTSGGTTRRETTAFVPTEATKNGYVKIEVLCTTNSIYLIDVNIKSLSAVAVGVTGVSLNTFSLSLYTGDTSTLTATVSPSDATNKNVSWASTNNSVASVSGGLVTAVGAGSATITVTTEDGSFTSSCSVTVTALVLSSISSSGTLTKSSYFTGQSFDSTGLTITATYNNSTTANVTSSVSWTPNPLTAGTTSVTGSYSTGGVTKTVVISGIT
ncbi:MAG TPA: Ig-like domain-containing protein, partial [Bacilli bacterium]|nr:Ig-like domain-containing protein [Bacilli bacterium]